MKTEDIKSDRLPKGQLSNPVSGYHLSFTAASLRPELARIVAECYLAVGDWNLTKERILSANALQCRSTASAVRVEREMRQRLETLSRDQLVLLSQATAEDRAAITWLAACKHIRFAFDFAAKVLRDKLATHDAVLRPSDYESYVENRSLIHPELAGLKASSKSKIRQVLMRMLEEANILIKGHEARIQRPALSPAVARVIAADSPHWLAAFLVPDSEISHRRPL